MSQGSIGDVPFSELTLNMLFGNLFAGACYIGALYFGFKSLEADRIWPWRWTLPYVGNLLVRGGFSAFFIYGAVAFVEKANLDEWGFIAVLVGVGVLLLAVFFSSEFEFFKERNKTDEPHES